MAVIRRLRRSLAYWFIPGVASDAELCDLLQLTASDLAAIKQEADARHRGDAARCYWLDGNRRRQWQLRQTLPLAVHILRGMK
jgi:hypothetical protein